jgi:hypothetical protein
MIIRKMPDWMKQQVVAAMGVVHLRCAGLIEDIDRLSLAITCNYHSSEECPLKQGLSELRDICKKVVAKMESNDAVIIEGKKLKANTIASYKPAHHWPFTRFPVIYINNSPSWPETFNLHQSIMHEMGHLCGLPGPPAEENLHSFKSAYVFDSLLWTNLQLNSVFQELLAKHCDLERQYQP